ncbi:MAG: hypothetical protein ABIS07_13470, partial [Dokdonella sp.]
APFKRSRLRVNHNQCQQQHQQCTHRSSPHDAAIRGPHHRKSKKPVTKRTGDDASGTLAPARCIRATRPPQSKKHATTSTGRIDPRGLLSTRQQIAVDRRESRQSGSTGTGVLALLATQGTAAPAATPELLAPGTVSTVAGVYGIALMPDGRTACFTERSLTTIRLRAM